MAISIYCLGLKAYIALEKLDKKFYTDIDCLIIGRDHHIADDYAAQIKNFATQNNINFAFRGEEPKGKVDSMYHIAIGWKWLIKLESWQRLYVIHDSLLPKYRGFNPLVTALINGDEQIGATCFLTANEFSNDYDTGLIIEQKSFSVQYPCKIEQATNSMAILYADLLFNLVDSIFNKHEVTGVAQDENAATYSLWRDKKDYFIDWNQNASYIKRFVDAVGSPYDGACFSYEGQIIRVVEVNVVEDVHIINREAGKVFKRINTNPVIVCKTGLIEIVKMIGEDKKEFKFDQFRIRLYNEKNNLQ